MRRRSAGRTIPSPITATLLAASTLALGAQGATASPSVVTAPAEAETMSRSQATEYWTAERIAASRPLEMTVTAHGENRLSREAFDPAQATSAALKSVWVRNAERYPSRVHGKLVGTYRGLGDFSCSATVVSSRSGSLLTTAGHCAYDAQGIRRFATNLAFVPGFANGRTPYGVWSVTNVIMPGQWARGASLDYDVAMMRTAVGPSGSLEKAVGSRGIGFNQPRDQRLQAYGYPSKGKRSYNGRRLIRCGSGQFRDPFRAGGPSSRGMRCDMQQGSSGGGWVAQHAFVVSNTSHGYTKLSDRKFYGPYYGGAVRRIYRADVPGWPSIGPVRCKGRAATIIGTDRADKLRGGKGTDVIAALGGNDRIRGGKGKDHICGGWGRDRVRQR